MQRLTHPVCTRLHSASDAMRSSIQSGADNHPGFLQMPRIQNIQLELHWRYKCYGGGASPFTDSDSDAAFLSFLFEVSCSFVKFPLMPGEWTLSAYLVFWT